MSAFAWNVALALLWAAVLGELTTSNLAAGFAIGFVVLAAVGEAVGSPRYGRKALRLVEFVGFFFGQLLLSSLRVGLDIVTPSHRARPGIVAVPLRAETDLEITALANFVSLTPGSLSLDLSEDRKTLYVHVMFLEDADAFIAEVQNGFERRLLELLR